MVLIWGEWWLFNHSFLSIFKLSALSSLTIDLTSQKSAKLATKTFPRYRFWNSNVCFNWRMKQTFSWERGCFHKTSSVFNFNGLYVTDKDGERKPGVISY